MRRCQAVVACLGVAVVVIATTARPGAADVVPGDVVTAADAERVEDLLSPGWYWHQGEQSGTTEAVFTIAELIASGR